jgi:putative ABC transport system permease protein
MIETLWQDVRYGFRMLWKSPGFTVVAVLALALGVGANTAIFSVVNAVLLRPLPYAEPERLVILWEKGATQDTSVSYPNFLDWRAQTQAFEQLAAFRRESFNLVGAGGEPERLAGRMVSASFFSTLGIRPFKGRDFPPEEDRVGGNKLVILSHGFWQRRFGGDENVIGQQLNLNNQSYSVIGITPSSFRYGSETDIYVLIGQGEEKVYTERGNHPGIYVIGRLKPGLNLEQGRADMDTIMARLGQQYPDTNTDRRIHIESLYDNTVEDVRPALLILLGAVGFVLLIACANVANLLLARSAVRQREIAIRTALGAGRRRIMRQLLTESVLLSLIGGGAGLLLALWGTDALKSLVPGDIPRLDESGLDLRVLSFTMLVSVITGIVFGIAPAAQASRLDLNEALKEGERGSTGSRHRLRGALVIGEIAIALVLLIGAGLMLKSLWRLQSVNTGFDAKNLLTMQLSYRARPDEGQKARSFFEQLKEGIKGLPGVESVAFSNGVPFLGAAEDSFWVEGRPKLKPTDEMMAVMYNTTPEYFRTMGIDLKKGRYLNAQDRANSQPVVVIDETLAQKYFPNEDPIGQHLVNDPEQPTYEIVGVVEHVKHYGLDGESPVDPQFYFALEQVPDKFFPIVVKRMSLLVRTSGDPLSLVDSVRRQVLAADNNQPVYNARTMEQVINESIAPRRFAMLLLTIFAGVALLLAAVGIYGVMSYSVTQRTHEVGVRIALGASVPDILKLIVGQGMLLVVAGVGIGLVVALVLTRLMSSLLFGVSATDPVTFIALSLLLAGVALLACYIPARRATKVDPMVALRYE